MAILNDKEIVERCMIQEINKNIESPDQHSWVNRPEEESMIHPFVPVNIKAIPSTVVHNGGSFNVNTPVISYGVSSFGYDARLATQFKVATPVVLGSVSPIIDPKNFDSRHFVDYEGDSVILPPHSFLLGHTVEYFRIPEDVMVLCLGKSTYARCGLIVNVTPLEPGWEGQVTIEISNTTPLPARIYAMEGIAQFIFFQGNRPAITYADRKGKYQGQTGVTTARI